MGLPVIRFMRYWLRFFTAAFLLPSLVWAQQNPNGVIPVHTSNQPYLFLVRDPVVHQTAKLTDAQKQKLTALNNRLDPALWSMRNKGPQQIAKVMASVQKQTQEALETILQPEQIKRIQQVEYWVLDVKSLLRDDVARQVQVSEEQQGQIRQIIVTAENELAALQEQALSGGELDALNEKWSEIKHQQRKDVIAVLSNQQQQTFRALLGDQVNLGKLGRIKMKVPDFDRSSKWINSPPLTLDKLKGKVVALHFYAFA